MAILLGCRVLNRVLAVFHFLWIVVHMYRIHSPFWGNFKGSRL